MLSMPIGLANKRPDSSAESSAIDLFEIVQEVEDSIGRRVEFANNLAIGRVLLRLERASGIVDVPKGLRHLLPVAFSDAEHPVPRILVLGVEMPLTERVSAAVTMTFPPSLAHARRSDPRGEGYNSMTRPCESAVSAR